MEPSRFVRICPRKRPHDAIGIMTAIGPVQTVSCGGVMKAVLNVHITNGSETAVVALWGAHATQFHAENLQQQADHGPVVIFLHGNPQVVRAIEPNFGQKEAVHVKVFDICDLNPHEALGNSYIVKIAIKDLVPAEAWWYIACNTSKRGQVSTHQTNHDAKTAEFTFFGEIGYQLIGIPVLNLVASVQGARDIVPSEIKAVFGKQYVIRTSVSRGSLQRNRISYQVDSLMLASLDAAHTSTLPSHDASVASSQHGSSLADAIEPHTIIGSSLQSMTPSTPLVLPDPKVLAMAQPDKKRKSSVIDEDLAQEGNTGKISQPFVHKRFSIFTKTVHIV
uniref:Replication protein A OB domain-containing protein n=1 Tax=Oryza barthii TaxID=65489 RepID=A0A0D3EW64_9ORYZ